MMPIVSPASIVMCWQSPRERRTPSIDCIAFAKAEKVDFVSTLGLVLTTARDRGDLCPQSWAPYGLRVTAALGREEAV
jgi:hypothetical protein